MTADIENLCAELQHHLDTCRQEVQALKSGKKSSAPRARKSLQTIKTISHKLRGDIITHTKALPTKSRVKKQPEEEPVPDLVKSLDSDEEVHSDLQPPKLERQAADEVIDEPVEEVQSSEEEKKASTKKATKKRVIKKKA